VRQPPDTGHAGLGKAERLSGTRSEWWSRRIDEKNRLVYRLADDGVEIVQCRGHYDDK
jgi:toxin YoeB